MTNFFVKRGDNRPFFSTIILAIAIASITGCAQGPATKIQTETKSFQETVNLQHYVLLNYHGICQDILAGRGDYLQAFFDAASVPQKHRQALIPRLKQLVVEHPQRYDFALQSEKFLLSFQAEKKQPLPLFV